MVEYTVAFEQLVADFKDRAIPTDRPGFYDHENFTKAESENRNFLNNYGAYVVHRQYSSGELQRAREIVTRVASILYDELEATGRKGACIDISLIMSRILECEGIWNCVVTGCLTIKFPQDSNEGYTHFWHVDYGKFNAPHAWLIVPPFNVVDLAVLLQPYNGRKKHFLPRYILSESVSNTIVERGDIINPTLLNDMSFNGYIGEEDATALLNDFREFNRVFPVSIVTVESSATLKYCPYKIGAPDAPFEKAQNIDFGGRSPFELYNQEIRGKL